MLEKMKLSFGRLTVKIALGAAAIAFISQYLPWLTDGRLSQSLASVFAEDPEYYVGLPTLLAGGLLWVALCFLLNHPKLALVGILSQIFIVLAMVMTASKYDLHMGFGFFIYSIAVVTCIVMVFLTRKIKN